MIYDNKLYLNTENGLKVYDFETKKLEHFGYSKRKYLKLFEYEQLEHLSASLDEDVMVKNGAKDVKIVENTYLLVKIMGYLNTEDNVSQY